MAYMNREFPTRSNSSRWYDPLSQSALQSPGFRTLNSDGIEEVYSGSLTYLQFIAMVKKFWEESHPQIPVVPTSINRESFYSYSDTGITRRYGPDGSLVAKTINDPSIISGVTDLSSAPPGATTQIEYPAVIAYALELRKAHSVEPKPRMRQNVLGNSVTIYGQKFQNILSFSVLAKVGTLQGDNNSSTRDDLDTAVLSDQIVEAFEDFMLEFTPIFKAAGASELVYSRRLSDSEINRDAKDVHKRTVTYMLTTEKTFAIRNERIEKISIDARTWMAYEPNIVNQSATPNYEDIDVNIVDLHKSATPNY